MYRSTRAMICGLRIVVIFAIVDWYVWSATRVLVRSYHVAFYKGAQRTQRMLLSFGTGSQIRPAPLA
jgi:hypothetical protein